MNDFCLFIRSFDLALDACDDGLRCGSNDGSDVLIEKVEEVCEKRCIVQKVVKVIRNPTFDELNDLQLKWLLSCPDELID